MEITIFNGREKAINFLQRWAKTRDSVENVVRMSGGIIVEIEDEEEAQELIDELDRLGMNYEEEA